MIRREIHGPDIGTEQLGRDVYRPIRPVHVQLGELVRSSFMGFLLIGAGVLAAFLPVLVDLVVPIGVVLTLISLTRPIVLPFRLPRYSGLRDRNHPDPKDRRPRLAAGIEYLGQEHRTNRQIWATADDSKQHYTFPGTTGAGKTRTLLSTLVNALCWGSGFILVDGKGDNEVRANVMALARRVLRDDDVMDLNFLVATGRKHTNTFNPFAFCNADVLRELLVSQIEDNPQGLAGDPNGVFKAGAIALLGSLAPVLVWLRDNKRVPIDIEKIRFATELRCVATLVAHRKFLVRNPETGEITDVDVADMPEALLYPLRAYLGETGDFDFNLPWNQQKTNEPARQHSFVLLHFRQTFTQLAVSLGHIFKHEHGDIDPRDIVLNRRILVVILPALENSGETTAALGKLITSSLRNMMAQTLGGSLEGDYAEIVENKASNATTPYPVVLDEVGYYAGPGLDKMLAMGRGLGFSFRLGFQEVPGLRARLGDTLYSLLGNMNIQILLRLQEGGLTREYVEKTAGDTFVTQTSGYDQSGGGYERSKRAAIHATSRVSWRDLREQIEGEAIVLVGKHRIYARMFFARPDSKGVHRINRPVPLPQPDPETLQEVAKRIDRAVTALKDGNAGLSQPTPVEDGLGSILAGVGAALRSGRPVEADELAAAALAALPRELAAGPAPAPASTPDPAAPPAAPAAASPAPPGAAQPSAAADQPRTPLPAALRYLGAIKVPDPMAPAAFADLVRSLCRSVAALA
jgi:intracellular multiplication protein IcmO